MSRSYFYRRRRRNIILLVLMCCFTVMLYRITDIALLNVSEWTGWLLFAVLCSLLLYGIRKRLSMLPIGRVAHWLQLHIYSSVFALFVLLLHLDFSFPTGWFSGALASSFIGTILTGLIGLVWSRTIPCALTRLGDEVLYERIPPFCTSIRNSAEQKGIEAISATGSRALADFYEKYGHSFFAKPRFQWRRLFLDYQPSRRVERHLSTLSRYMNEDESRYVDEMRELAMQKDLLDAHYTYQGALKHWLFVHLAFSLSVIPLVLLHIVLIYSFTSA